MGNSNSDVEIQKNYELLVAVALDPPRFQPDEPSHLAQAIESPVQARHPRVLPEQNQTSHYHKTGFEKFYRSSTLRQRQSMCSEWNHNLPLWRTRGSIVINLLHCGTTLR